MVKINIQEIVLIYKGQQCRYSKQNVLPRSNCQPQLQRILTKLSHLQPKQLSLAYPRSLCPSSKAMP